MVIPTQQAEIVELGGATVRPGNDVMHITPVRRPGASRSNTVSVTCDNGPSQSDRDDSGLAAYIEKFGARPEHDAGDGGVAHELSNGLKVEYVATFGFVEATR